MINIGFSLYTKGPHTSNERKPAATIDLGYSILPDGDAHARAVDEDDIALVHLGSRALAVRETL